LDISPNFTHKGLKRTGIKVGREYIVVISPSGGIVITLQKTYQNIMVLVELIVTKGFYCLELWRDNHVTSNRV